MTTPLKFGPLQEWYRGLDPNENAINTISGCKTDNYKKYRRIKLRGRECYAPPLTVVVALYSKFKISLKSPSTDQTRSIEKERANGHFSSADSLPHTILLIFGFIFLISGREIYSKLLSLEK